MMIVEGPRLGAWMRAQLLLARTQRPLVERMGIITVNPSELDVFKVALGVKPSVLLLCASEPTVLDDHRVDMSVECYLKVWQYLPPHFTYESGDWLRRAAGVIGLLRFEKPLGGGEDLEEIVRGVLEEGEIMVEHGMLERELFERARRRIEALLREIGIYA